jgi:predicted esterase
MQEHHISVNRTARYFCSGTLTPTTKNLWFVLHGYGQLAQFFIKKFAGLANDQTLVIAPEALSRYYLENGSGRVGATWMTREDRSAEIADYLGYLNALYDRVSEGRTDLTVNVLGFSQGAVTALRWVNDGHIQARHLVLWAGYFSNGISELVEPERLSHTKTSIVYGTQDEFLKEIDLPKYEADLLAVIPNAQITTFDGTHLIDVPTLHRVIDQPNL